MLGGYSEHMGNEPDRNVLGVVDRAIAMALPMKRSISSLQTFLVCGFELGHGLRRERRNQRHPHRPVFRRIGCDGRRIDPVVALPDHHPAEEKCSGS